MSTYADFLAQFRREMEEPSEGVWQDSSVLVWTNQAGRDFAKRTKILRDEVYADTTAGTTAYSMPDYTLEPIAVYYDGSQLRREDYDVWVTLTASSGTPTTFAVNGDSLVLWPTPDAEGEMRYFRYRYPDPIDPDDEDASDMPFAGEFDDALMYYVKAKATEQVNDWTSAAELRRLYFELADSVLSQASIEAQSLRSTSPREVY